GRGALAVRLAALRQPLALQTCSVHFQPDRPTYRLPQSESTFLASLASSQALRSRTDYLFFGHGTDSKSPISFCACTDYILTRTLSGRKLRPGESSAGWVSFS